MYKYAQINSEGIVGAVSWLSGKVDSENMILVANDFDLTNKKYLNGEWVSYEPESEAEPEYTPTETELIQAELLLNQQEIIIKQNEHDEVLAAILLGQQTV